MWKTHQRKNLGLINGNQLATMVKVKNNKQNSKCYSLTAQA